MNMTRIETQKDILFISEQSARYHSARIRFLTLCHRWLMFLVALMGTAVVADIFGEYSRWFGGVAAVIVILELVFDLQGTRSIYQNLYRRFTLLSGEITANPNADEATVRRWNMQLHALYADEPPVYRALNDHVRNEIAIRIGRPDEVNPLRLHHRLLMHICSFQGYGHGQENT